MEQYKEDRKVSKILEEEERKCFGFFWNEVSESGESYGLIRDNDVNCDVYKDSGLIYHSYCGGLFVYQFSHAFLNLQGKRDRRGIDWYENSRRAVKAARQYCIDNPGQKKTYGADAWGMTACMTPHGYSGAQGALPCVGNDKNEADGTVPPCGAIGSMPFCPEEVESAARHYASMPLLQGKYGFRTDISASIRASVC